MAPSKKHPLEVFRGIGQSSDSGPPSRKIVPAKRKKQTPDRSPRKAERSPAWKNRTSRGEERRSPGDFKVTLTLNQILASLLFVTVLVLGGYFAGYYKGDPGTGSESLSSEATSPALLQDPAGAGRRNEETSTGQSAARPKPASGSESWGVLLAVYNMDQKHICDETFRTLVKQGINEKEISKVRYPKNKKYGLIIGSFDRQNDPALIKLRKQWRAYKAFPYGDPAPFKSAKIARLP